jgi:hypothetical protein
VTPSEVQNPRCSLETKTDAYFKKARSPVSSALHRAEADLLPVSLHSASFSAILRFFDGRSRPAPSGKTVLNREERVLTANDRHLLAIDRQRKKNCSAICIECVANSM